MERDLNRVLMKILHARHPQRIESGITPGLPDINCAGDIWIESKWLAKWPKKGKIVQIRHFTSQQRVWHKLRHYAKGKSFVVLQVDKEYLLFNGLTAANHLGKCDEFFTRCHSVGVGYWKGSINAGDFLAAVSK